MDVLGGLRDQHPDGHACRVLLSLALQYQAEWHPWDLVEELRSYTTSPGPVECKLNDMCHKSEVKESTNRDGRSVLPDLHSQKSHIFLPSMTDSRSKQSEARVPVLPTAIIGSCQVHNTSGFVR